MTWSVGLLSRRLVVTKSKGMTGAAAGAAWTACMVGDGRNGWPWGLMAENKESAWAWDEIVHGAGGLGGKKG